MRSAHGSLRGSVRLVQGNVHAMRPAPRSQVVDGWLARVDRGGGGCWLWQGATSCGYAHAAYRVDGARFDVRLHRFFYEYFVGPIPDGLDLDHLCRVRHCINPDHLEPVTRAENLRRSDLVGGLRSVGPVAENAAKTHCIHGHPFDEENTHIERDGKRRCRTCDRERQRRRGMSTL